jgi:hypothetical protein
MSHLRKDLIAGQEVSLAIPQGGKSGNEDVDDIALRFLSTAEQVSRYGSRAAGVAELKLR